MISVLYAIIILGILVIVHELGHFLFAKMFGVGVAEFSVGFGKIICQKKYGETWYSLRLIPLGGFVRMAGEDPGEVYGEKDSDNKEQDNTEDKEEESSYPEFFDEDTIALMKNEDKWFLKKKVYQKFLIAFAGPLFNILFAFLIGVIYVCVWGIDVPSKKPIVGAVMQGYPAEKSGIKAGDEIVRVNGERVKTWVAASKKIGASKDGKVDLLVKRHKEDDKVKIFNIRVKAQEDTEEFKAIAGDEKGKHGNKLKIGIMVNMEHEKVPVKYAPLYSLEKLFQITYMTYRGFKGMILGKISTKHLGGPIEIIRVTKRVSEKGLERLLDLVIFISMTLAIMNLLPIPVLDGGYLLFFLIEAIIRRPVPQKVQMHAMQMGMALLLLLTFYAISNDITRLVE